MRMLHETSKLSLSRSVVLADIIVSSCMGEELQTDNRSPSEGAVTHPRFSFNERDETTRQGEEVLLSLLSQLSKAIWSISLQVSLGTNNQHMSEDIRYKPLSGEDTTHPSAKESSSIAGGEEGCLVALPNVPIVSTALSPRLLPLALPPTDTRGFFKGSIFASPPIVAGLLLSLRGPLLAPLAPLVAAAGAEIGAW